MTDSMKFSSDPSKFPQIDPGSVRNVWELGIYTKPEVQHIGISFRYIEQKDLIPLLQAKGDKVSNEDTQISIYNIDLDRAEGLVTMLREAIDALKRHTKS